MTDGLVNRPMFFVHIELKINREDTKRLLQQQRKIHELVRKSTSKRLYQLSLQQMFGRAKNRKQYRKN